MLQGTELTLIKILASCLFGTKLLSETMLVDCQLDIKEVIATESYLKIKFSFQGYVLGNVSHGTLISLLHMVVIVTAFCR